MSGAVVKSGRTNLPRQNARAASAMAENVNLDAKTLKIAQNKFGDFVCNMMEPSAPFLLPRLIPTEASPDFQMGIKTVTQNLVDAQYGSAIVRADPYNLLSISEGIDQIGTNGGGSFGEASITSSNWVLRPNQRVFYNAPLELTVGGTGPYAGQNLELPATSLDTTTGVHLGHGGTVRGGATGYPNVSLGGGMEFKLVSAMRLPTLSSYSVTVIIWKIENGNFQIVNSTSGQIGGNSNTNFVTGNFSGTEQGFAVSIESNESVPITVPGGFLWNIWTAESSAVSPFPPTIVAAAWNGGYKTYSIFELLGYAQGTAALRLIYDQCERLSVSGLSCLVQNTTAKFYRSGTIVAAQFPGGSELELPGTLENLFSVIGGQNTVRKYDGELSKGCHWTYFPEKIQDFMFQPVFPARDLYLSPEQKPFAAFCWSAPSSDDNNILGLKFTVRMNVERLTPSVAVTRLLPCADSEDLIRLYLLLLAYHNNFSENPDHIAKVKRIAKSIVTSPQFKALVRAGGNAMLGNIPSALGDLAQGFLNLKVGV